MKDLVFSGDTGAVNITFLQGSDTIYNVVLTASSAESITIPARATYVLLSATNNYYTKIGAAGTTAAIPSDNVIDGSGSALNKAGYAFRATDTTISFISPGDCIISLEFYE